jgi:hypothetical protein
MTGRGAGYCAGYSVPGFMNPVPGWGFGYGWGRGFGRGFGRGLRGGRGWGAYMGIPYGAYANPYFPVYAAAGFSYPPPYGARLGPEAETDMLKGQAEYFEDALEGIKKRLAELETEKEK